MTATSTKPIDFARTNRIADTALVVSGTLVVALSLGVIYLTKTHHSVPSAISLTGFTISAGCMVVSAGRLGHEINFGGRPWKFTIACLAFAVLLGKFACIGA